VQESRAPEPILPLPLFVNKVFAIGDSLTLLIGLTMFGATAFMPIYMQVVKGVSATDSGLHMLPMSLGAVTMSWFSGRMITQTGHYRIYPIAGTALLTAGMFLMSRISEDTSFVQISIQLAMLGSGMGLTMQVVVLAIQNAVDHRDLGAATASTSFFRSMGGAFGVAIFGAVLTNRLNHYMGQFLTPAQLNSVDPTELRSSPEVLRTLPAEVHAGVIQAFAHSIDTIFLVAAPCALIGFILALLLPELPLRSRAPQPRQAGSEGASAEAETERIAVAAMMD
jgi:Na+/melibiose symporter-like transporter